jgi:hypothetical protein
MYLRFQFMAINMPNRLDDSGMEGHYRKTTVFRWLGQYPLKIKLFLVVYMGH